MSTCSSCGANIVWATTALGKRMPVDAEPADNGNIRLDDIGLAEPSAVVVGGFDQDPAEEYHLSHFASCPDARQHRKPR